jgi:hypothetical protein
MNGRRNLLSEIQMKSRRITSLPFINSRKEKGQQLLIEDFEGWN